MNQEWLKSYWYMYFRKLKGEVFSNYMLKLTYRSRGERRHGVCWASPTWKLQRWRCTSGEGVDKDHKNDDKEDQIPTTDGESEEVSNDEDENTAEDDGINIILQTAQGMSLDDDTPVPALTEEAAHADEDGTSSFEDVVVPSPGTDQEVQPTDLVPTPEDDDDEVEIITCDTEKANQLKGLSTMLKDNEKAYIEGPNSENKGS
jgi:hypothetical protein